MDERMFYDLIYNTVRFFIPYTKKNIFAWQGMPAASELASLSFHDQQ
jgi:hypothetical protein